ncbi:MAG: DUF3109 family protein [Bacteroidetes bacterium]|nr:DUF3109 family protein [Bacteroidota bacterium]
MIIHEDTLISDELLSEHFACNLKACKGACCIEGDKGAPLSREEVEIIEKNLPEILNHLEEENREFIKENGFYEADFDGELVTTCLPDGRCAFVRKGNDGVLTCGIEHTYYQNRIDFIKPISCHLYPVRIREFETYTALNYHRWPICSPACDKGQMEGIKVFEFVETALRRRFGDSWYDGLVEIDRQLKDHQ